MEFSSTSNESSLPVFNGQKGRGGKVIVHKWQSWIVKVRDCVFPTSCSEFRYPSDSRWTLLILSPNKHGFRILFIMCFMIFENCNRAPTTVTSFKDDTALEIVNTAWLRELSKPCLNSHRGMFISIKFDAYHMDVEVTLSNPYFQVHPWLAVLRR